MDPKLDISSLVTKEEIERERKILERCDFSHEPENNGVTIAETLNMFRKTADRLEASGKKG